jgi:uncharacterized RDD family membrane protein YckC
VSLGYFIRRIAANFIDVLIIFPASLAVWLTTGPWQTSLATAALATIYRAIADAKCGKTAGKAAVGLRTVSIVSGGFLTLPKAFVREGILVGFTLSAVVQTLPWSLIIGLPVGAAGLVDLLVALADDRARTIHDRIAGSAVLRDEPNPAWRTSRT